MCFFRLFLFGVTTLCSGVPQYADISLQPLAENLQVGSSRLLLVYFPAPLEQQFSREFGDDPTEVFARIQVAAVAKRAQRHDCVVDCRAEPLHRRDVVDRRCWSRKHGVEVRLADVALLTETLVQRRQRLMVHVSIEQESLDGLMSSSFHRLL